MAEKGASDDRGEGSSHRVIRQEPRRAYSRERSANIEREGFYRDRSRERRLEEDMAHETFARRVSRRRDRSEDDPVPIRRERDIETEDIRIHRVSPPRVSREVPIFVRERARARSIEDDYVRDRPPAEAIPMRSRSRVRRSRGRAFAENLGMRGSRRGDFNTFETSEALFNESIQTYYQTGEGVGAVEALLPDDSDDEGPRRLSSLPILSGTCPHGSRRRRRFKIVTKPDSEVAPEQCECGKEKTPKAIK
jgi:hypothetical protein